MLVFGQFDYSWGQVLQRVSPDKFRLLRPIGGEGIPWLGTLIGLPVAGFYYWAMNQYVIQRQLGARDLGAARRAATIAAGMKLFNPIFMVIPGAMAIALLPHLDRPDKVFPQMIKHFAPPGLTGLLLAGLAAALMSSLSAILNSSATLVTLDFVQPRKPDMSDAQLAWCGRLVTFIIAGLAAAWAPIIQQFSGLFNYIQQLFAYVASPLVAVFLIGLFDRRLGGGAALRALICGHLISACFFVLELTKLTSIHYTISAGIVCAGTAVLTYGWMAWLGERDRPPEKDARLALIARQGLERVPRDMAIGCGVILLLLAGLLVFLR